MRPYLLSFVLILVYLSSIAQAPIQVLKTGQPPVIDGILNDPVWSQSFRCSDFTTYAPEFGKPATFETSAMITFDEENFYVAFDCKDSEPDKIKSTITARDQIKTEDWVCINLDPFFDRQSMVTLYINPFGIQEDGRSSSGQEDMGADYVFYSQGTINSEGYQVEIRVPFKSLRYQKKETVTMGFIFERRIQRLSEQSTWPALKAEQGMNFLTQTHSFSFTGIKHYTLLELLPAFTYTRQRIHENGVFGLKVNKPSLSLTGKVGLTSQLVMDVTLNPDFSQVESDAGQIEENQRYALFYPEKRPFFQEGKENFDIAAVSEYSYFNHVFHTRQVANPLAGIKLSGKLDEKNRVALLYALDNPYEGTDSAQVRSNFIVGRYHYTIKNDTYIGAVATFKETPETFNRVAGLDGRVRLNPSTTVEFNLLGSSSPDTLAGKPRNDWLGTILMSKQTSRIEAFLEVQHIGTCFNSESGYLMRSGLNKFYGSFTYTFYSSKGFFRRFAPFAFSLNNQDLPSGLWEHDFGIGISLTGERSTRIEFFINPCNEVYLSGRYKTSNFQVGVHSQVIKSLGITSEYRFGYLTRYVENPYTGFGSLAKFTLVFQPVQKFRSDLSLSYSDFYQLGTGIKDFRYLIVRSKNTFQVNPKLFVRAIAEYNSFEKDLTLDLLVSFTYIPGTVIHLGYGSLFRQTEWTGYEYQPGSNYMEIKRGIFFKASYLWRN